MARTHGFGTRKPCRQRRHAACLFERILRAHDEPDFVEIEAFQSLARDMRVAFVGGIEGTAEQAHAALGRQTQKIERWRDAQGRVCPAPRTTYL